jgi:glutaredoxin
MSLLDLYPELCEEWDYERNEKGPKSYSKGSNQKVWWKCKNDPCGCHEWGAVIYNRTNIKNSSGCPYCSNKKLCKHNNLLALFPELYEEWDYERNEKGPESYPKSSSKKVWWKCKINPCGCHRWEATINHRTNLKNPRGCPYCSNQKLCKHNNLLALFPELCEEWDYERNKKGPEEYSKGFCKKVWWKCRNDPCGCHRWEATISKRTNLKNPRGCPYCSNQKLCKHNNLSILCPELCKEWDYERNEKSPEEYSKGSCKKVWWKCRNDPCGCHRWEATIANRAKHNNPRGCPYCSNRKLCEHNNLSVLFPELCEEWDYERNEKEPESYTKGSGKRVWWNCKDCDSHIWKACIYSRTNSKKPTGCPLCMASKGEKDVYNTLLEMGLSFTSNNIENMKFTREYSMEGCELRYDFYGMIDDKLFVIEYDGIQHFEFVEYFYDIKENLHQRQMTDRYKSRRAMNMGIKSIHIDYTFPKEKYKEYLEICFNDPGVIYFSNYDMYWHISY